MRLQDTRDLACVFSAVVACTELELGIGFSEPQAAAATVDLSLTGGAVRRPGVSRNRLPGDASSLPEAAPGRLLWRAPSPQTIGELWKGVIFTLGF